MKEPKIFRFNWQRRISSFDTHSFASELCWCCSGCSHCSFLPHVIDGDLYSLRCSRVSSIEHHRMFLIAFRRPLNKKRKMSFVIEFIQMIFLPNVSGRRVLCFVSLYTFHATGVEIFGFYWRNVKELRKAFSWRRFINKFLDTRKKLFFFSECFPHSRTVLSRFSLFWETFAKKVFDGENDNIWYS